MTDDVAFVMALPGWDVLYYFHGGRFETAPIVAWGVTRARGRVRPRVPQSPPTLHGPTMTSAPSARRTATLRAAILSDGTPYGPGSTK